jgi:hypothetical protein
VKLSSSAVFHSWTKFSSLQPVNGVWIQWKAADEIPLLSWIATAGHNLGYRFHTGTNDSSLRRSQFCSKFPLFPSAYYYYWFYMFLI